MIVVDDTLVLAAHVGQLDLTPEHLVTTPTAQARLLSVIARAMGLGGEARSEGHFTRMLTDLDDAAKDRVLHQLGSPRPGLLQVVDFALIAPTFSYITRWASALGLRLSAYGIELLSTAAQLEGSIAVLEQNAAPHWRVAAEELGIPVELYSWSDAAQSNHSSRQADPRRDRRRPRLLLADIA